MRYIEHTDKIVVQTEKEANTIIDNTQQQAREEDFILKKAAYEHKVKKAKGEIQDEAYVVTIVKQYGEIWE